MRKLAERLGRDDIIVDWAMRYGNPSIASRMDALEAAGCERILVFPLYPQYAAATTATVNDTVFDHFKTKRWQPALRTVPPYHDDPVYIDALARSLRASLAGLDWEPEVVLASFHGIPKSYFEKGDPYHCQCAKTGAARCANWLGFDRETLKLTFQSRFGPEEWLQPYTDKTVEALAPNQIKSNAWPSSRRGSRPIAWRPWRKSVSRMPRSSTTPAARNFTPCPASTIPRTA